MTEQVDLLFEKDDGQFIVSDDITIVYGVGNTQAAEVVNDRNSGSGFQG